MGRKQKTTEEVKEILGAYGYKLAEHVIFSNVKEKMEAIDDEGYRVFLRFNDIPRYKPKPFHINNQHTIWNIINIWLPKNAPDYELLDEDYYGNEAKMKWKHKYLDLPIFEMNWHCFKSQKRHPILGNKQAGESNKKTTEEILLNIQSILQNEDKYVGWNMCDIEDFKYEGINQIISFEHVEGYRSSSEVDYILNKNGLILFHTKHPKVSLHNIETYIKNKNIKYTLKEGQEYRGRHEELVFTCPDHGDFLNNFNQVCFKMVDCPKCFLEKISGENSVHWNPNKENDERILKRQYIEYYDWMEKVLSRDGNECQICGENEKKLNVHHKDGYHWCEERRTDVENGIVLCEHCHRIGDYAFHRIYGNKNNTQKQFDEWVALYKEKITKEREYTI